MSKSYLIACMILIAAAFAGAVYCYSMAPERIPIHWNIQGRVDAYGSPKTLFLTPAIMAAMLALFLLLPMISPRRFKIDSFRGTYDFVVFLVIALTAYMDAVISWATFAPRVDLPRAIMGGLFLFLTLLGNVLGKVKRNFWVGIRTPWTLASDRVWRDTHRLAARILFIAGPIGFLLNLAGVPFWLTLALFFLPLLIPTIYSLVEYKRLEKTGEA